MLRERIDIFKKLVYIADLCLVAMSYQVSVIWDGVGTGGQIDIFGADNLLLPAVLIWGLILWYRQEYYNIRLRSITDIVFSLSKISMLSSGLFLAYVFIMGQFDLSRFQIVVFSILSGISVAAFRVIIIGLLGYYRSRGYNTQTVLIVGTGSTARNFTDRVLFNSRMGLKIIGFIDWERRPGLWRYQDIPSIGMLEDLPEILKSEQVDWVIFAVGRKYLDRIENSIEICEKMGIYVAVLADFFTAKFARRKAGALFDFPLVYYDMAPALNFSMLLKGALDRILAVLGIIIAMPIMIAAALVIRLTSKGPIVFKQERCGLNGRKFTLYKFRTMVENAEQLKKELADYNEMDGAAFKIKNDPRITAAGKFLRKTSIDELPQFFNILKGDMSLVGPRPPLQGEVINFDLWQRRKLSMKPGLTGLWQISGRSNISFDEWMKLDLKYIDNWSLWEDTKILAKTVPAVLKGTGAR